MPLEAYQIGGSGRVNVPLAAVTATRNPTTTDKVSENGSSYALGQLWINTSTNTAWMYFGGGLWAELSAGTGDVLTLSDNANVLTFPTGAGNIKLAAGAGITTAAGTNTITIAATGMGFQWVAATTASPTNPITMVPETGYSCSGAGPVTFLLPAGSFGDSYEIITNTGSGWSLSLVGQTVEIAGTLASTSITSTTSGDVLELLCIAPNTFQATDVTGNLTIV